MYGVEEITGRGGLAGRPSGGPGFLGANLRGMNSSAALIGGPSQSGIAMPVRTIGSQVALPQVSGGGGQVEHPAANLLADWRQILDFHNSPAPWILIMLLAIYGWTHVAARGRR